MNEIHPARPPFRFPLLPFLGFFSLYLVILVFFMERIFGRFSWAGFGVATLPAALFSILVIGLVKRKYQERPLVNIEFFWNLVSFGLMFATTVIVWAAAVTPDHVEFQRSVTVSAPAERIWRLISDPRERPRWDPYLEKVDLKSGTPAQLESVYHFEINATGTRVAGDQRIIEIQPLKKIVFEIIDEDPNPKNAVVHLKSSFFLSDTNPVHLTMVTSYDVHGLLAKVMSSLIAEKFMKDSMETYTGNLRQVSEGKIERVQSLAVHLPSPSPAK